jgi:hypothetical protein
MNDSIPDEKTDLSDAPKRRPAPPGGADPAPDLAAKATSPLSAQHNPRVRVSREVIRKLAALGVPDNGVDMGHAVDNLVRMAVDSGTAYLPDLADITAIEKALADRIEEMNRVHLELLRHLVEFDVLSERESFYVPLKDILDRI